METRSKKENKSEKRKIIKKEEKHPKKNKKETEPEILEKGLIYFFYRPKVGIKEAHGPEDVQKMYFLLWPGAPSILDDEQQMKQTKGEMGTDQPERLMMIAKKELPNIQEHGRYWGYVETVSYRVEDIDKKLGPTTYTTKTRGERHVEGARPVGEGVYALVMHHGRTHLAFVLELPEHLSQIQKAFHIEKEGSFVIQVKNPEAEGIDFLGSKRALYSPELMKSFVSEKTGKPLKFTNALPQHLNYSGSEFIIIGASNDLKEELGETGEYIENLEKIDSWKITSDKLWRELKLKKAEHPTEPLIQGKWK